VSISGRVALLVALWLLAWGDASVGNLVSGVAVAVVLLVAFPPGRRSGTRVRVSALGVGRLLAYVARQLLVSNLVMAREIVRRNPRFQPAVLAHRLGAPSEEVVALMTSIIALSPGTMTVDVDGASSTIHVHFLLLHDVDRARDSLVRLEQLAVGAIAAPPGGRPAARAASGRRPR
jgi:multicomponent Na+:H+ antiporter subunit E